MARPIRIGALIHVLIFDINNGIYFKKNSTNSIQASSYNQGWLSIFQKQSSLLKYENCFSYITYFVGIRNSSKQVVTTMAN